MILKPQENEKYILNKEVREPALVNNVFIVKLQIGQQLGLENSQDIFGKSYFQHLGNLKLHNNKDFVIAENDVFPHTFYLLRATCIFLKYFSTGMKKNPPKFELCLLTAFVFIAYICLMFFM